MRILELFSGTGSVGKVAKKLGYEVISLDIDDYNGKFIPTHKEDIMTWNYKQYDKDYFDTLWASPPCVYYSALQRSWYGIKKKDGSIFTKEKHQKLMEIADSWVLKVFEIIEYFNLKNWYIENPRTGALKERQFMDFIPYIDVDYCMYCDWGYRKQTRVWTNTYSKGLVCNGDCGNIKKPGDLTNKKHKTGHRINLSRDIHKLDRYRIPPKLIESFFRQM